MNPSTMNDDLRWDEAMLLLANLDVVASEMSEPAATLVQNRVADFRESLIRLRSDQKADSILRKLQ